MAMLLFRPMFAIVSDMVPLFGYHKSPWIFAAFTVGFAGSFYTQIHKFKFVYQNIFNIYMIFFCINYDVLSNFVGL